MADHRGRFCITCTKAGNYCHVNLLERHPYAYVYTGLPKKVNDKTVKRIHIRKRFRGHWGTHQQFLTACWIVVGKLNSMPLAVAAIQAAEGDEGVHAFVENTLREVMDDGKEDRR